MLKNFIKYSLYSLSIFLAITVAFPGTDCYAQNQLRIYDDIGGSSSSSNGSSSSDNTFIYVAGGLIVAGILAYAFLVDKDEKEESDSTGLSSATKLTNGNISDKPFSGLTEAKEKFPIDIYFGIRNDEAILQGRTYLLGFSFKL